VRSPMGAVVRNAEAVVVDRGWLRVLGAPRIGLDGALPLSHGLVVGHDALGGFFVVRGDEGDLPGEPGHVLYLAPDTLQYEAMRGAGYGAWLRWALSTDLADFGADLRWPGWEDEVGALSLDQAIHTHPPLFAGTGEDVGAADRRPVPVAERWSLRRDLRDQLGVGDGV